MSTMNLSNQIDTLLDNVYKSKSNSKMLKGIPIFVSGFIVSINIIVRFDLIDEKINSLTFKSIDIIYTATTLNAHSPTNDTNKRKTRNDVDDYWEKIDNYLGRVPSKHTIVFLGDYNAQIGKEKKYS